MHQLPSWVHMALLFWVLTVEVGLVFMIFGPRMFRRTACVYLGMLHVFYILVGNQGTFHWNQLVLSLVLLDDGLFPSIVGMLQRVKEHGVFATQQRIVADRALLDASSGPGFRARRPVARNPVAHAVAAQKKQLSSAQPPHLLVKWHENSSHAIVLHLQLEQARQQDSAVG